MTTGESFNKLKTWIDSRRGMVRAGKPASDDVIRDAQRFLGLRFPDSYVQFLKTWGTLALGPMEFYGIAGADFEKSTVPNGIWFTNVCRKATALPHELVVLWDNNGDEFYCLDTSSDKVMVWDVLKKEVRPVKTSGLFDFILQEFEEWG